MKIYQYILYAIIAIGAFTTCGKSVKYSDLKSDDILGEKTEYVYGRLFLFDTLTQRAFHTPLASKKIYVRYADATGIDTLNYLYSGNTDALGYFRTKELNRDRDYVIWYEETIEGKLYRARHLITDLPVDSLRLIAELALNKQTGILFSTVNQSGNLQAGADICVFQNKIPYDQGVCDGNSFSIKSDQFGKAYRMGLSPGFYYLLSKIVIKDVTYLKKDTFTIIADNVISRKLELTQPEPATTTSVDAIVVDQFGQPVSGASVCLFKVKELYARDTCEGSNYSAKTNVLGKVKISGIEPGYYYILGDLSLTNYRMIGRREKQIEANQTTGVDITLFKY